MIGREWEFLFSSFRNVSLKRTHSWILENAVFVLKHSLAKYWSWAAFTDLSWNTLLVAATKSLINVSELLNMCPPNYKTQLYTCRCTICTAKNRPQTLNYDREPGGHTPKAFYVYYSGSSLPLLLVCNLKKNYYLYESTWFRLTVGLLYL